MVETMTKRQVEKADTTPNRSLLIVAWVATLLVSTIAVVLWNSVAPGVMDWWPWVPTVGLIVLLALAFASSSLRPLRPFLAILLIIFLCGYGGGWNWGLLLIVRDSPLGPVLQNQTPLSIGIHLLRLTPALIIIVFLLLLGRRRPDFFLIKGKINAPVEPSKLINSKETDTWVKIGSIFAVVFSVVTLAYLFLATRPTLNDFVNGLPLIPVAVLIAAINAFNEEFTLRAAPLSELWKVLGKHQALLITAIYFGLGHFYGVPSSIIGVILATFLGWFLGKSLLETKGFFWAWTIHFVQDAFIFIFFAMGVMT
jgi:membrane protease YdiL (CAAX protease family)